MRPIIDNLEQILDSDSEKRYEDEAELSDKIEEVFDELWMILDYCFIGALFYLNTAYIHSGLFAFSLFIWLMAMIFLYPRERRVRVDNKEELLEVIDTFYKKNEMDK